MSHEKRGNVLAPFGDSTEAPTSLKDLAPSAFGLAPSPSPGALEEAAPRRLRRRPRPQAAAPMLQRGKSHPKAWGCSNQP